MGGLKGVHILPRQSLSETQKEVGKVNIGHPKKILKKIKKVNKKKRAVHAGIEPATCRLTAECAAAAPMNHLINLFVESGYIGG